MDNQGHAVSIMVGLRDISPAAETVEVNGDKIPVPGVSAAGLVFLINRYPAIMAMLGDSDGITSERLAGLGIDMVAAIIAAGCGFPGDEKAESVASQLNVSAQVDLLEAILRRTMPKGIGPFVEGLARLAAGPNGPVAKEIKMRRKDSPRQSRPSSNGADIQPQPSGQ